MGLVGFWAVVLVTILGNVQRDKKDCSLRMSGIVLESKSRSVTVRQPTLGLKQGTFLVVPTTATV